MRLAIPLMVLALLSHDSPSIVTVIRNVNLVPMTSETVIPARTVIVEDGLIKSIGRDGEMRVPAGADIVDGRGGYLMPGLADMHVHYLGDYERSRFFNFFLKNGVTTVRLFQSLPNDSALAWREETRSGRLFGPTLFACGPLFDGPDDRPEAIRKAPRNYDFIKIYSHLSAPEFEAVMRLAKQENVYAIGHVPYLVGLDGFIAGGMNEVAHVTELDLDLVDYPKDETLRNRLMGLFFVNWMREFYSAPDEEAYLRAVDAKLDAIVAKVKASGMAVNTTLVVDHILFEQLFEREKFLARPELRYMLKGFMTAYLAGENVYQQMVAALVDANKDVTGGDDGRKFLAAYVEINRRLARKLRDAGVPVLLGTDTPTLNSVAVVPGYSVREELGILCRCGFTPYEAIETATANAGRAMRAMTGIDAIGTIEVGKQADLILTSKNPLEDVSNIGEMRGLMVRGRWLTRDALDALPIGVRTSLADALQAAIEAGGDSAAVFARYREIKAAPAGEFAIVGDTMDILGNGLLKAGMIAQAIAVFQINVIEFPEQWDWHNSLANAYVKAGDKARAVESYAKALSLAPDNPKVREALQQLKN